MEKLREEHETYQEEQALVVAVAAPVLAAVHRDLALAVAVASIAQEVFHLEETLLASLPPVVMLLTFYPNNTTADLLPTMRLRCLRLWPDADLRRRWSRRSRSRALRWREGLLGHS